MTLTIFPDLEIWWFDGSTLILDCVFFNILSEYMYIWLFFSSGHVWMWELDYKESLAPKNWCFWTAVLEKTLESPLDCKEIQPVHPEGNQSWMFIGRTNVEDETPILWPPDAQSRLIWKGPDAGKDWRQEKKGTTEDDGWMASLTQWTWVWVNSGSWWWTGRPGMLQSMGSQRVGHDWVTELNWMNKKLTALLVLYWFFLCVTNL